MFLQFSSRYRHREICHGGHSGLRSQVHGDCRSEYSTCLGIFIFLLLFAAGSERPACSAEVPRAIPLELQVQIFLKIMTYNRNIQGVTADKPFYVGILQGPNSGQQHSDALSRITKALYGKKFLGREICIQEFGSSQELAAATATPGLLLVLEQQVTDWTVLEEVAYKSNIVTGSVFPDHCGKPVGIVLTFERENPVIWLNLQLVRGAGADFQANFLKHCRVRQ